ncbi:MAG: hypothetical protein HY275_19410, partial [Gemmatimonadetes bacterium]|nr:hypothetical protein [Gemmatimonadota bacterium]
MRQIVRRGMGAAALVAAVAAGAAAQPAARGALPPAGFGSLRQDDIAV